MASKFAPSRRAVNVALVATLLCTGCANSSDNDKTLVTQARQASESDELSEAEELAQKSLERDEDTHEARKILADLARRQAALARDGGDAQKAYRHYREAADLEPSRTRRADDLLAAVDTGRRAGIADHELLPLALAAVDGRPQDLALRRNIAGMAEDLGRPELALEHYLFIFSAAPADLQAGLRLGLIYLAQDRPADAASVLQRVVDADEDNSQAILNLAQAYAQTGRHDDAARLYDNLLERFPENPVFLRQYADFEEARGDDDAAQQLREQANELAPSLERPDMRPLR